MYAPPQVAAMALVSRKVERKEEKKTYFFLYLSSTFFLLYFSIVSVIISVTKRLYINIS